jgi:hypothetical protein
LDKQLTSESLLFVDQLQDSQPSVQHGYFQPSAAVVVVVVIIIIIIIIQCWLFT